MDWGTRPYVSYREMCGIDLGDEELQARHEDLAVKARAAGITS